MDKLNSDTILAIANKAKEKYGIENHVPLYPMLRVQNKKLYIGVMFVKSDDNVWDKNNTIKPEYWLLIDINSLEVVELNKTSEKDFVNNIMISKKDSKQQELSKYTVEKTLQYQKYLLDDIKNEQLPIQKKLSNLLNNEMVIDDQRVNINDYIMANIESDIKEKIDELVELIVQSKYSSITIYYDNLVNQIIEMYKKNKIIEKEKINICVEVMNNYYDGVVGISNFFNIS